MPWEHLFDYEVSNLVRLLSSVVLSYLAVMIMLRLARTRVLSRMTAFDMIIPLTLGPILAATILTAGVSLIEGLTVFGFLILFHSFVSRVIYQFPWASRILEHEPTLLFYRGDYNNASLAKENITHDEVRQAARAHGLVDMGNVYAVILEPDGSINVLRHPEGEVQEASLDVAGL